MRAMLGHWTIAVRYEAAGMMPTKLLSGGRWLTVNATDVGSPTWTDRPNLFYNVIGRGKLGAETGHRAVRLDPPQRYRPSLPRATKFVVDQLKESRATDTDDAGRTKA